MKKIGLLLIAICCVSDVFAQQTPLYSQYFDNPLIYNPAYAGLDRFGSINMSHRQQWTGVSSDVNMIGTKNANPETSLFSVDIPVYDFTSGVGIQIMKDRIGFLDNYQLKGNYAYHFIGKYVDSSILSFGLSVGYNHVRSMLPTDAYSDEYGDEYGYIRHTGDPKLLGKDNGEDITFGGGGAFNSLEAAVGLNYMFKDKFQVGIALDRLVSQGIRAKDNGTNKILLEPNLLVSLKCTLKTYDELHYVEPQGMVRFMNGMPTPLQFDAGIQYTYNQLFWVNTMFRSGGKGIAVGTQSLGSATDSLSNVVWNDALLTSQANNFSVLFAMGLKLQRYRLGIAADFMAGELAQATGSTFEIVFGYKFAHLGQQKYPSPAGRNSKIRFKKRHPSIPGPLSKKRYMGSPKQFKGRKN